MRWKDEQYAWFAQQLRQLLSTGMTVVPSLQAMQEQQLLNKAVGKQLISHLEQGGSLAQALMQAKFTELFVSFIRTAEEHGQITEGLQHCEHFYKAKAKWRNQIQQACIYPVFVLIMILITMALLFQWVLPRFANLYYSLGVELPLFTQILFQSVSYFPWIGGALLLIVGLLIFFKKRTGWQPIFYQLPGIRKFYLLRWTHYLSLQLGSMLQAGIPLLSAMDLLEKATPWHYLATHLSAVKIRLLEGSPLYQSLEQEASHLVSSSFPRLIAIGERHGSLDQALLRIAQTTEIQIEHRTERMMRLLEPGLLIGIGGMVAITVLALFLPMLSLVEAM